MYKRCLMAVMIKVLSLGKDDESGLYEGNRN